MSTNITSLKELFDKTHIISDAKAAAIGISNKVEGGSFAGFTEITDMVFYKEMWRRDPEMAKVFISTQINRLEDKCNSLTEMRNATKEEIKLLEKLMNYQSDKVINTYIKSTSSTRNYGMTATIAGYFRENLGVNFDAETLTRVMQGLGMKGVNKQAVSQSLFKLCEKGAITKKSRGIYVMEEANV